MRLLRQKLTARNDKRIMKVSKQIKKARKQNLQAKFNISSREIASRKSTLAMTKSGLFVLIKKIQNNFIAYYLLLSKASPRKLQPYYHTGIYTLIRLIARILIKIKQAFSNLTLPKLSRQALSRAVTVLIIVSLVSAQSIQIRGFEAHVINVTAKIINDIPLIQPDGGQFCNITGATISITTTYVGTSTIIYTTDGSDPVCPSTGSIYTAPFTIYQSATVKARTCHDEKQSAVSSKYFTVAAEFCPASCNAETISYWQNNQGCQNSPEVSEQAALINSLSANNFQGAFSAITGGEICTALDLTGCQPEGTLTGELCRARGQTLAVMSNVVTGRLDLNAVIAGAFDNSANFTNLNLTASSTIKQALNKIETILVNPGATEADLANAKFVAQRIYTFYNSENPYAPEPTCIYYEPGEVVLNEFVPNPSCAAQPVDVVMVMDRSASMAYTSKCDWWEFKCVNPPSCSSGYNWVQNTTYNLTQAQCNAKNQSAPHQSVWTQYSPVKITAAKQAANYFLDLLGPEDQSSLVSYATTASLDKQLSSNHAATAAAINGLITNGATDIGDAITLANNELTSIRASSTAPKIEILLTDGKANKPSGPGTGEWPADVAYAKAKADQAAALGIKIFTIGLGGDVNTSMLQYIATSTGAQYYFDPTGADLQNIYTQISEALCDGNNDQGLQGLGGEWVELYNKGNANKNLVNWMIGNAATTTTVKISSANTLTASTIIGAVGSSYEWLVVLFNQARLNNNGDTIFLYDNLGHLLDFYSYISSIDNDPDPDPNNTPGTGNTLDGDKAGLEGKSFARIPDGIGDWIDPIPTPGAPNRLEENINLIIVEMNEIATTGPEASISQDTNNFTIIGDDTTSEEESNNQTATSTPDLVSTEENAESDQPAEEPSGEAVISPEQEIIESGEEIIETTDGNNSEIGNLINNNPSSLPEEIQIEPASEPEPSQEETIITDASQEQAIEPAAIPTESAPNSENTTL